MITEDVCFLGEFQAKRYKKKRGQPLFVELEEKDRVCQLRIILQPCSLCFKTYKYTYE